MKYLSGLAILGLCFLGTVVHLVQAAKDDKGGKRWILVSSSCGPTPPLRKLEALNAPLSQSNQQAL